MNTYTFNANSDRPKLPPSPDQRTSKGGTMRVYVVYENVPVILGTTVVSSYERLRFIGLTHAACVDFRNKHSDYNSTIASYDIKE